MYERETLEYGKGARGGGGGGDRDDEESEAFAQIFHSLVHSSPALSMTLAQLEHDHAVSVAEKCDQVARELRESSDQQVRQFVM